MTRQTHKQMAEKLLKLRREGYPHWRKNLFGKTKVHYLRWVLIFFLLISLMNVKHDVGLISFISILLGFLIGAITKETLLMKQIGDSWDFSERVTDWEKVEAIAEDEEGPQEAAKPGAGPARESGH